jgi:hypothetical protein
MRKGGGPKRRSHAGLQFRISLRLHLPFNPRRLLHPSTHPPGPSPTSRTMDRSSASSPRLGAVISFSMSAPGSDASPCSQHKGPSFIAAVTKQKPAGIGRCPINHGRRMARLSSSSSRHCAAAHIRVRRHLRQLAPPHARSSPRQPAYACARRRGGACGVIHAPNGACTAGE